MGWDDRMDGAMGYDGVMGTRHRADISVNRSQNASATTSTPTRPPSQLCLRSRVKSTPTTRRRIVC